MRGRGIMSDKGTGNKRAECWRAGTRWRGTKGRKNGTTVVA